MVEVTEFIIRATDSATGPLIHMGHVVVSVMLCMMHDKAHRDGLW